MLLRYFNFSYPSRLVSLLLLAAFLWLPSLIMPVTLSNPQWISPLFQLYLYLPIHAMWVSVVIAFLINLITALTVNSLAVHFGLSEKTSYLSAFLYLLFSSALPGTTQMSPFLLINFFQPQSKYVEKSIQQVNEQCTGFVKIKANLIKTFVSKKGARIGIFKQKNETILAVMDKFYYPSLNVTAYATASRNGRQCWLFVKKLEVNSA